MMRTVGCTLVIGDVIVLMIEDDAKQSRILTDRLYVMTSKMGLYISCEKTRIQDKFA